MHNRFHLDTTKFTAIAIAILLWALVHGQGMGSRSIDVPLQIQGLPARLIIVNNLPERVRMTVSGPQARLSNLNARDIHVALDTSSVKKPGVEEIALVADNIKVPSGLKVDRIQPDRIVLQIDQLIERKIKVFPRLELPDGWVIQNLEIKPESVLLKGPEVWLDGLSVVKTSAIQPEARAGEFSAKADIESPAGKAIRLVNQGVKITIRGQLSRKIHTPSTPKEAPAIKPTGEKKGPGLPVVEQTGGG